MISGPVIINVTREFVIFLLFSSILDENIRKLFAVEIHLENDLE
jgi:hypothetical protein